ncbi:hypothetical protein AURDEDRAFT_175097 [Auricularia subglabra TFB-10046 SS5]|uniref:DUF7918 domain-containing protein n=1 Tax=Auricularia subglabra (strain TFB-10046 / SS5) TaxID=717982 RepID=J0D8N3_AURST|nr:hypothetical protein AURDEDRAFT_175097 [Auricularia subglabra TFB-10046 SS5]
MMQHRDFEAWISSDGIRLPAHSTTVLNRTITCWIATTPGKPFSVHWKDLQGGAQIRGTVYVDGERACGALTNGYQGESVERSDFMVSPTASRALRFATVDAIEQENVLQDGSARRRQEQVIVVKLSKVVVVGKNGIRKYEGAAKMSAQPVALEEDKALEPLCVSLGPERAAAPHTVVKTRPLDPTDPGHHVVFEFHYRSQTWLEARGIIPVGDQKTRINSSPKICKLEDVRTEIATLRRRLKGLENWLVEKEEAAEDIPPLKLEPAVLTSLTPGNFIDLTAD